LLEGRILLKAAARVSSDQGVLVGAQKRSRGVLWTPRYFARSVGGAPLSALKQYIEQQKGAATCSR
jgi:REP element-mobilizing transposase RayT